MEKTIQEFRVCWARFKKRFERKLYEKSESQQLTYKRVSAVLKETQTVWESKEHPCGSWLGTFLAFYPEQGAMVKEILMEKLSTTPTEMKKGFSKIIHLVTPFVGAVLGFCIAKALGANVFISIASFLAPFIVLLAAMKNVSEIVQEKNTDCYVSNYLEQLETYKDFVIEILKEEEPM